MKVIVKNTGIEDIIFTKVDEIIFDKEGFVLKRKKDNWSFVVELHKDTVITIKND